MKKKLKNNHSRPKYKYKNLWKNVFTSYIHTLYLLKKLIGDKCKVYCETGTLFGGSLGLVMQDETPCLFIGVDLYTGYYGKKMRSCDRTTTKP